ncbi:apolipoprotein N-acyltransferase [Suttonella ornithocola]|uniref:Apolipoprotein N-acyltransferase n=1 Tax=Suttonella ornithocola TaxID=279832 RepID=A0A380MNQ6_9GAMM|nr:apolipoprotein N-acyltransferase [Suttonella ornithocola]SUO93533.1 Apolipoprotein N-acyltransferase [Suttonella ornithocola]
MHSLISFVLGSLLSLSFAPFNLWWLAFISLTGIFVLWLTSLHPGRIGFLFGLGNFTTGVYWVYISLNTYGDAPLAFAILANITLILYLSLYPMLVGWLLGKLSVRKSLYRAALIPLLWLIAEFIRSYVLTGFPWLSIGYSQMSSFLHNLAPIFGSYGVGLVLACLCTLFAYSIVKRTPYPIIIAIFIIAISAFTKNLHFTKPMGEAFSVALVQGNASQYTKFDPNQMYKDLDDYIALSANRKESVIIWPETAIAFMENAVKDNFLIPLDKLYYDKKQTLVTGIATGNLDKDYYNSVITLGNGSRRYSKEHLLPFGEFTPMKPVFNLFNKYVDIPMSDFSRGGENQKPILTNGIPAGASICYEAAFGRVVRQSLPNAQYLINVSNDGWFQDSIAADQHLQMNQMRALELGREMARATNNGYTVFIDHHGHIISSLPRFEQGVLAGKIQPRIGLTPYAKYGNNLFLFLLALYAIIVGLMYPMQNRDGKYLSS